MKPLLSVLADTSGLQAYQEHKGSIFDSIQMQLAGDLLDKGKRSKATLGNVAYAIRQLNDISRLESDKSTVNVLHAHIEAIKTMREVDGEISRITDDLADGVEVKESDPLFTTDESVRLLNSEIARITRQDGDIIDDS